MQTRLAPDIKEVIGKIPFLPAITIIMPFNPKMDTSRSTQDLITSIKKKVNKMVIENYDDDLGILVLQKFDMILKRLNYSTPYESVAIFVSPVFEKVLYLNYPVKSYISIDENFSIHQAVLNKNRLVRYLVIDQTSNPERLCYGNEHTLFVVKTNRNMVGGDLQYFRRADQELKILTDAYKVPVFVIGSSLQLAHFQRYTKNYSYIVKYIPQNKPMCLSSLFALVSLYFDSWTVIENQFAKNLLKNASRSQHIACGLKNAIEASNNHQPVSLYINEMFVKEYNATSACISKVAGEKHYNRYSYIKSRLDELIEQVLQSGGEVNFMHENVLDGFYNVCLIYK